ncbi:Thymidylate kinase [Sedimentisphaera cyanobacteriorum]|uniref:Thymidylate kinase n=1 Tax=Sedimentisphaera cyanobacteriorum TaxID=1940790 RepID=A0A1Q2HS63_9BACT|nr:dTMP kinase [Sedimentisphaera cyanobacteriorum]AQQ10272.1 Thymidylate kinase [Sedimentisphaera cyanobacteriorum]
MISPETYKGKFIVLDGPDGSGKSTQAQMLREALSSAGIQTAAFRDPGDTVIAEKIRDILLSPEHSAMSDNTEVLLYMAARAQLWKEKIYPAIDAGKCVVMDRWLSSTCAYQGKAGGFGIENVIKIAQLSLPRVWPDKTFIIEVDPQEGLNRITRSFDRMEQKGIGYHRLVYEGFLELAAFSKHLEDFDVSVVSGYGTIEQVHRNVLEELGLTDGRNS